MVLSLSKSLLGVLAVTAVGTVDACTMIAAGKNATTDGSTLMAHTDDAGGGAADLRLVRVPAADHAPGSKRAVYSLFGGYPRLVTHERGPHYEPKDASEQLVEPLGHIAQVAHTYAYFDQDYGMMNEVQLSIVESTCGAKTVGWSSDVPHGKNWFGIAELSKVALERCDSARCAVRTMGGLAVQYGFYSEDSGDPQNPGYDNSAEALGIADKYGEVWLFHVLTGKDNTSAIWAAQRVQDDHVSVIANGFVIRAMDLADSDNFMASPNVTTLAEEMGWWTPEMGPFDFSAAYGYKDTSPVRPLYVGRRVWRVLDVLAPSLQLDPRLGTVSEYPTYPFSVKPDQPVEVETMMNLLRDYYQGTPYDMSKGLAAGPFGNPMRWDGDSKGVVGGWERPISMFRTMFSFVLQARAHLDDSVGGVMWYAQSTPHGSVYVPFSCRQHEVPASYLLGKQSEFDQKSAWWAFEFVKNWSMLRFDAISKDIRAKVAELQAEAFDMRQQLEKQALELNSTAAVDALIQSKSNDFAASVVDRWWQFAWHLVGKFSDGYITTGEAADQMETPGYPKWWLETTEFAQWPGESFSPREDLLKQIDAKWKLGKRASGERATMSFSEAHELDASSGSGSILRTVVGMLCGVAIGAGLMWGVGKHRRSGYSALP